MGTLTKVTFRKNGKAHRGLRAADGYMIAACKCPGSRNGQLVSNVTILCDGWDKANCEQPK